MERLRWLVEHPRFGRSIMWVIVVNAVLIGVELYIDHPLLRMLEWACVAIFTLEVAAKLAVYGRRFFGDGWNWFDLIVVASAWVPGSAGASSALRLLRVLRVLRLVSTLRELRLIVTVLTRSVVSMSYIGLLMLLCFYIYGVAGVKLFGDVQANFATLHEALFTLFQTLTGDNWGDIRNAALATGANYWLVTLYHVTWIILSTFLLINLIVGAVMNNYQEVQDIERRKELPEDDREVLELAEALHKKLKERGRG